MFSLKTQLAHAAMGAICAMMVAGGSRAPAAEAECDEHGVAAYAAVQVGETVTVFANGVHRSTGFKNCLGVGPKDAFPPIFDFQIKRPTGIVIPLLVPFVARAEFQSQSAVPQVTVRDANGPHRVDVVQLPRFSNESVGRLQLNSTYQHTPIDFGIDRGFHGVGIAGRIADGQLVDLSLDPNSCSLNEFGDRVICTAIALTRIKARLTRVRLADPQKLGRSIYRLEAPEFPSSLLTHLIAPRSESGYRLVLKSPRETVVVALETSGRPSPAVSATGATTSSVRDRAESTATIAAGLCQTVGKGSVGESGASHLLHHSVTGDRQIVMVVRNVKTSLCGNTNAIAVLSVNGEPKALGNISSPKSLIQVSAKPDDQIVAVVHTIPLFNDIVCKRLGELNFTLEQCDLE